MKQVYISDAVLLGALARNESAAMNEIYRRYYDSLVKWIVSRGGLDVDAEDAFQEAVLVLYQKSQDEAFCLSASIGTYLFAICKRLWLKKLNHKDKNNIYFFDEFPEDLDQQSQEDEDIQLLQEKESHYLQLSQSLEKLGSPCKELLQAFYIENKSMQDIATQFSYTNTDNAKTQKYKCLNRLKKLFFGTEKDKVSIT